MGSLERKVKRQKEIEELLNIKNTYGKKPRTICPKCKKKSLFIINNKNETYCIRCDQRIK